MGDLVLPVYLFVAALWALQGTNAQARLAKQRLVDDEDPAVAAAGRLWTPLRWLSRPSQRDRRQRAEAELRKHLVKWGRYRQLCQELAAWNALKSSVALALVATIYSAINSVID